MKNLFNLLFLISPIFFLSCEKKIEEKPISTAVILNEPFDSVIAIGSGATSLTSAFKKSRIQSSGNLPVTSGILYDDTAAGLSYTNSDNVPADTSSGSGVKKVRINRLKPLTKYYYRFFAQNYKGLVYSQIDSFLSAPRLGAISLDAPTNVTNSSAKLSGKFTGDGGEPIYDWGITYGLGQNPDITDLASSVTTYSPDKTVGSTLSIDIANLLPNRTYYVRTFCKNRGGTNYSSQRNFLTLP